MNKITQCVSCGDKPFQLYKYEGVLVCVPCFMSSTTRYLQQLDQMADSAIAQMKVAHKQIQNLLKENARLKVKNKKMTRKEIKEVATGLLPELSKESQALLEEVNLTERPRTRENNKPGGMDSRLKGGTKETQAIRRPFQKFRGGKKLRRRAEEALEMQRQKKS